MKGQAQQLVEAVAVFRLTDAQASAAAWATRPAPVAARRPVATPARAPGRPAALQAPAAKAASLESAAR